MGFLLLPVGTRTDVMTLEEAVAARRLAERISGLLSITSALERARRRQLEAQRQAEQWEASFNRIDGVLKGERQRHLDSARALARPLNVAAYSAAVRLLLREMELQTQHAEVVTLVSPVGVAAEAWAARLHIGWERSGPLFCVDAGDLDARSEARWAAVDASPLSLCEGGTLFIRDVDLLSPTAQEHLVKQLMRRWEATGPVPAPRLVVSVRQPPSALVATGLVPLLAPWLGKHVFQLPSLAERPEDLRALVLDASSRSSRGPERMPLGVDRAALQVLLDYPWPGNDAELRDVMDRAASVATEEVIRVGDLMAIGFAGVAGAMTARPDVGRPASGEMSSGSDLLTEPSPEHRPRSRPPRARRRR